MSILKSTLMNFFFSEWCPFFNHYHVQTHGIHLSPPVTAEEEFFFLEIMMGCLKYPNIHMYWNQMYGQKIFFFFFSPK